MGEMPIARPATVAEMGSSAAEDYDRLLLTGAGGWAGRCALDWVAHADPAPVVIPFVSRARNVVTHTGTWAALPTSDLPALSPAPGSLVIHAGFPTQDQVEVLGDDAYATAITDLRATMLTAIERLGPLDFVYLSSGAATSVERGLDVAHRTRVYGQAKLDDEAAFTEAIAATGGRLCIVRAFALSGPYMTKPEAYALGDMIMQADRSGTIAVQATRPVRRSYMLIDDMLRIAMDAVGRLVAGGSVMFETASEVLEMGDFAARVLGVLGHDPSAVSRPPINPSLPADDYLGDPETIDAFARIAGVTPTGLDDQIAITAEWLLRSVR